MKNDPAFPCETSDRYHVTPGGSGAQGVRINPGFTKREYLAALAMQAIVSQGDYSSQDANWELMAIHARVAADALIAELEK